MHDTPSEKEICQLQLGVAKAVRVLFVEVACLSSYGPLRLSIARYRAHTEDEKCLHPTIYEWDLFN